MRFIGPLILQALPRSDDGLGLFRLWHSFAFVRSTGETITVKAGFETDLCSLPRIVRPFISVAGRMAGPSIIHDALLKAGDPRAHAIFGEALELAGVRAPLRAAMVTAVRTKAALNRLAAALERIRRG